MTATPHPVARPVARIALAVAVGLTALLLGLTGRADDGAGVQDSPSGSGSGSGSGTGSE